jgi:outer membrane protein assembly factor BamB
MRLPRISLVLLALATAAIADVTPSNVATLVRTWTKTTDGQTGGPILANGRIYVGTWDSHALALDPASGAEIWNVTVPGGISGRVLVLDDGGVCYGTLSGRVGCLDGATGAARWTTDLRDPTPDPALRDPGTIWSAPIAANGRLFVGVAGLTDQPCGRGRLVALDQATGMELWRFYTVPDKVCKTNTAIECTMDSDCPSPSAGVCALGVGAGVTATPTVDPAGTFVYMNTVGCYTFPSIGESDSMFKIDAATGDVIWRNRVNAPEQFGTCVDPVDGNSGVDCGVDADCALVGGTCVKKSAYHDFGFLNGPLRIEVPDGMGGTKTLIVSGSKNGTLYAFEEATGQIAWTNVVRATPISPGFAGFGLFNGAIAHADGRIFAAINVLAPPRVCSNDAQRRCQSDPECENGGTCPPEPKHLMAFDATTGATVWSDEIGRSWSHVAVVNGVVYAGTNATDPGTDESWIYAYDAASGQRLATFTIPMVSAARAAVQGNALYVSYGLLGGGGIAAFAPCGDGTVDDAETCDGGACCADCQFSAAGLACDDTDACTSADQCGAGGACEGTIATVDEVGCSLEKLADSPCGADPVPNGLSRTIARTIGRASKLMGKASTLAGSGKIERAEKLRQRAMKALDALMNKVGKAAAARKDAKRITPACHDALDALIATRRSIVETFVF